VLIERSLPGHYQTDRQLTETASAAGMGPARRRSDSTGRLRMCDLGRSPQHVIGEELFRGALIRERKIADRLNQRFGVLLVTAGTPGFVDQAEWAVVIEALGTVKRDTDVFGWFERRASLGIIFPEVGAFEDVVVRDIEDRARRELGRRLDATAAQAFSVKLHIHQGKPAEPQPSPESVSPSSQASLGSTEPSPHVPQGPQPMSQRSWKARPGR